ncbi:MAG: hypothetical protein Q7K35_03605 [bacterium]|nr:hypothetical protein [bacterium]
MKTNHRLSGFTFGEILGLTLLLISIVGVVLVIVAGTMKKERQSVCLSTLSRINAAKTIFAHENGLTNGAKVAASAIYGERGYFLRPSCPSKGTYDIKPIGVYPTCSCPWHIPKEITQ